MDQFKTILWIRRLDIMKRNARRADYDASVQQQVRKDSDYRNHIACQTEHLWYVARAVERIAKAMGTDKHEPPTATGKKGHGA